MKSLTTVLNESLNEQFPENNFLNEAYNPKKKLHVSFCNDLLSLLSNPIYRKLSVKEVHDILSSLKFKKT